MCKIKSGGTPKSSVAEYYEGNIPFLSIKDMTTQGKHVKDTEKHITNTAINSCSTWVAPEGTLMYSICASVGNISFIDVPCAMNQAIVAMTNIKIDSEYLYYYLKMLKDTNYLESRVIKGAQRNINATILKDFDISYPSDLEEQKRIASVLSDLDELAKLHSLKVSELCKMKESLIDNKSGIIEREKTKHKDTSWISVKLSDICNFTKGKNPQEYNQEQLGSPIVSAPEIENTLGNSEYSKYTLEDLPSCDKDDILLLWDGSRAGISGFNHEAILSSTIMRLRVKDKDNFYPKLIYYMLVVNKDKISSNRTGSAIPHLNRQVVEDLIFELPRNIEEQKRIADILSQYDKMIDTQEELISIIQREREFIHQTPQIIIQLLSGKQ